MPKRHCLSHAAGGASCAAWQFRPRGTHQVGLFGLDFLWFFLVSRQERTLNILFAKIYSRFFVSNLFRPFRACINRSLYSRGCAPLLFITPLRGLDPPGGGQVFESEIWNLEYGRSRTSSIGRRTSSARRRTSLSYPLSLFFIFTHRLSSQNSLKTSIRTSFPVLLLIPRGLSRFTSRQQSVLRMAFTPSISMVASPSSM